MTATSPSANSQTWAQGIWRRLAERDSGLGIGLFRAHFALVALGEVIQMFLCRDLLFKDHPVTDPTPVGPTLLLIIWGATLILLALGIRIRFTSIVNWVCTMIASFVLSPLFWYHNDFAMWGAGTFFLLLPAHSPISVERWFRRGPVVQERVRWGSPVAYRFLLIFFFLGLYYLDSVFYKLADEMWRKGLAFWLPATLPHARWLHLPLLLDQEVLVRAASIIVIIFEASFIFLLPFRRLRWPLIALGIMLHVGIMVAYPIPLFALGILAFYWLLIPDELLQRWFRMRVVPAPAISPSEAFHPGWRKMAVLTVVAGTALQAIFTVGGETIVRPWVDRHVPRGVLNVIKTTRQAVSPVAVRLLGMTFHGVYVYRHHFQTNFNIIALSEENSGTWLPLFRRNGEAHPWCHDRMWVHVMFRAKLNNAEALEKGYGRLAEFFCQKHGWDASKTNFQMHLVKFPTGAEWVRQNELPAIRPETWTPLSSFTWTGTRFELARDRAEVEEILQQLPPGMSYQTPPQTTVSPPAPPTLLNTSSHANN